jgi:DNA polymerase-2
MSPPRGGRGARADGVMKSHAIKILMNSFYGVLGTPPAASTTRASPTPITGFGQELLLWCRERIEAGLCRPTACCTATTDSLFVETGADGARPRARTAERLAASSTAIWRDTSPCAGA